MHVGADVFTAWPDRASAKVVFSRSVSRIEVETHSYCNRRCNYCPNVAGDRLGENKRMRAEHWEMILGDLAEISFAGNLVFTSYNEPLADRAILDRIREARRALPRARLLVYSDGDYLDGAYLDELGEAGLHYLHISVHTRYNGRYSEVDALDLIAKLIRRVSRPIRYKRLVANEFILAQIPHPVMEIEVRAINFQRHGIDRAGLVQLERKPPTRTAPCHFVFAHFHVGFSGNVVPCCHVRSDSEAHAGLRYGNLDEFGSIFQAWAGSAGAAWRRELITSLPKRSPCDRCAVAFLGGGSAELEQARQIWMRHVQSGVLPAPPPNAGPTVP